MATNRPSLLRVTLPIVAIVSLIWGGLFFLKNTLNHDHGGTRLTLEVGTEVPDLELVGLDRSVVKLSEQRAKIYFVNFWATWCEACMIEMPSIVRLQERLGPKGLKVIGINVDENPVAVVPSAQKKLRLNFDVFIDQNQKLSQLFDVHGIPLTVILDQNRRVLATEYGDKEWDTPAVIKRFEEWLSR